MLSLCFCYAFPMLLTYVVSTLPLLRRNIAKPSINHSIMLRFTITSTSYAFYHRKHNQTVLSIVVTLSDNCSLASMFIHYTQYHTFTNIITIGIISYNTDKTQHSLCYYPLITMLYSDLLGFCHTLTPLRKLQIFLFEFQPSHIYILFDIAGRRLCQLNFF